MISLALALTLQTKLTLPGSPLGIAWGFLYGANGVPAERFVPKVRELGGGFSKVYLFWAQMEATPGKYDWSALDAYVNQLKSPDEGLVSLFSVSPWATRRSALSLPPSPAKDQKDYYRFVLEMVKHCRGRVRYWQNDSEPNSPIYWSGTKEEFVTQLKTFYQAVKDADPKANVVVGGYDGLFNPPGIPEMPNQKAGLAFFDYVLQNGRNAFDLFDLRLYANAYTITGRVETMRSKMKALGYEKPIICTEYGGPGLFEFPENRKYAPLVIAWSQAMATGGKAPDGVAKLYEQRDSLAPQTQIFLQGASPSVQAKFERIQGRDLVMRNLFALSAGVQKTLYWDLWNDASNRDDLMSLMYGKIMMFGYENGKLTHRFPVADAYRRMATSLRGVTAVRQIAVPDRPTVQLFEVERTHRKPLYVVWEKRDVFSGEDAPAVEFTWAWKGRKAPATDALGASVVTTVADGMVELPVSVTPIYIEEK